MNEATHTVLNFHLITDNEQHLWNNMRVNDGLLLTSGA